MHFLVKVKRAKIKLKASTGKLSNVLQTPFFLLNTNI